MDAKYAFGVVHAHRKIWKKRLLSAQGTSIKHYTYWKQYKNQLKLQLGTVEHTRQTKCGNGPKCGNYLANRAAKEAAEKGIHIVVPQQEVSLPDMKPEYSAKVCQLIKPLET